jgi:hypothetical protein
MTADELGLLVAKRVKMGPEQRLAIQTQIPAALSNLAQSVSRDPMKRNLLMTNPTTVTATVTQSATNNQYLSDISTVLTTNQAMHEALQYGTIWHTYTTDTFTSGDVLTVTNEITLTAHGYVTGLKVQFQTAGVLPDNIEVNTVYYIIVRDANTVAIAATLADALADTSIGFDGNAGSGNSTVVPVWQEMEWLQSPAQGTLESCISIPYITGYLIGDKIYLNNVTGGILRFAVPFTPTLATFPQDEDLEQDLVDQLVAIIMTGDPALDAEVTDAK